MTRASQLALCVVLATAAFGAPSDHSSPDRDRDPRRHRPRQQRGSAARRVDQGEERRDRRLPRRDDRSRRTVSIPDIHSGEYQVRAELSGFRTTINRGVMVTVGGTTEADLALTVGQIAEESRS